MFGSGFQYSYQPRETIEFCPECRAPAEFRVRLHYMKEGDDVLECKACGKSVYQSQVAKITEQAEEVLKSILTTQQNGRRSEVSRLVKATA